MYIEGRNENGAGTGEICDGGGGSSDGGGGEPIVVSIGLLSPHRNRPASEKKAGTGAGAGRLHPLDQFTLDIFVFNQSSWTRRFEMSHPEERRRRQRQTKERGDGGKEARPPGSILLQNRVRIGYVAQDVECIMFCELTTLQRGRSFLRLVNRSGWTSLRSLPESTLLMC